MAFWRFWDLDVLREIIREEVEERLMGYDEYGSVNKNRNSQIELYQYPSFNPGERKDNDKQLLSLVNALLDEVKRLNKEVKSLNEEVKSQKAQIKTLSDSVEKLEKAQHTRAPDAGGTAAQTFSQRRGTEPTTQRNPARQESARMESPPNVLFRENAANYNQTLQRFAREAEILKTRAEDALPENSADKSAFLNLIDRCIRDFTTLWEKSGNAEAVDLAEESAGILKKTVCKALAKRELKPHIEEYLRTCGVRKLGWPVGKRLTDKDYAYLEEPVFYDDVKDPSQHGVITKIEQESYCIGYQEDGFVRTALIPGSYHIGKYRGASAYPKA